MNRMRKLALIIAFTLPVAGICQNSGWQPPANPDPSEILREARADRDTGRYQLALDKHVWYHDNALKYDRAHGGVRLSFALSDWRKLANRYPPALEKMREFRERAELWVKQNKEDFDAFHDFVSLNTQLKEEERTVYLFRWLDEYDPSFARRVYPVARDTLVAEGEYQLCGEYIDIESIRDDMRLSRKLDESVGEHLDPERASEILRFRNKHFAYEMAYAIAILVRIGQSEEANEVAGFAIEELQNDALEKQIVDAQSGVFPERIL